MSTNQKYVLEYFVNDDGVPRTKKVIPIESPCKETFLADIARQYTNDLSVIEYENFAISRKDLEANAFSLFSIDEWFDKNIRSELTYHYSNGYTINQLWQNLGIVKSYTYMMSFIPPDGISLKIMDEAHIMLDLGDVNCSEILKTIYDNGYTQYDYCNDRKVCDIISLKVKRMGLI